MPFVSYIIDDFILFGPKDSNICRNSLQSFIALAESVGLPLNLNKTVLPTTCAELHGILVDTVERLAEDPARLRAMGEAAAKLAKPDAAAKIAQDLLNLALGDEAEPCGEKEDVS